VSIPFSRPYFPGGEADALADVIASRWVTQGPRVRAFEAAFAERTGAREAVATTNGTTALHLALYGAGVGPGDEVIVPSLSFVATANAVWHCGAVPVFADVDASTYNLDPAAAERAISPRTKAIMPVHQLGLPADMDAFVAIGERQGVAIVEDAACAVGSQWRGRPIGSLDTIACFSLHARKVITTGEGGMITTNDPELAERLRRLRHHGMDMSDLVRHAADDVVFEDYPERGWNHRMTDFQAAVGLCQLDALEEILTLRRAVAERYTQALENVPGVTPPVEPADRRHSWQSYAIRLDPAIDRLELMRAMLRDGIATRRGVTAIHHTPAYAEAAEQSLPNTDASEREAMLLPIFPELTGEQADHVVERLAAHVAVIA
jgi:dTDP-4-amino-4,6-dideoxygalactose transaminase